MRLKLIAHIAAPSVIVNEQGIPYEKSEPKPKSEPGSEPWRKNYSKVEKFYHGLAAVMKQDDANPEKATFLFGFVNEKGEEVVPCKYITVDNFTDLYARVQNKEKLYGFINVRGTEVVPCKYEEIGKLYKGLFPMKFNGKWGFVNLEGKEVVAPKYDSLGNFYRDRAKVELNGKWGFVNLEGKEVVAPKYTKLDDFENNNSCFAVLDENGKKRGLFIDVDGEEVDPYGLEEHRKLNEETIAPDDRGKKRDEIDWTKAPRHTPINSKKRISTKRQSRP